ncbi:hypothetical protein TNCT_727301 [Trichonephila clavata]|uniref:Uncharacterized protein n=1 Tax=Trichonephila clavata TaxID=2740835 RepID=A0A8X6KUV6_TRICU|nr:hypothetical protein TNCT_727301 [Trichonephila clavata]
MPKERIFLQSQEKKSSSDAKEDKMKHSGNPEVITQSEIVLSKGLASILTNLRETRIDTAKKENQHIILENVSEERNFQFSCRKIQNCWRKTLLFTKFEHLFLKKEFRKQHDEPAVEPSFIENVSEERNISNSHAGKSGKNKSFNSDVDNHARREKIFLQSQERKNSSSDAKKDKMKHSGNVDNHAKREKIFLQSQDRKHSSSDAKEDKMKHSGNPEVMNTELNSPQQGSSKYFDKLERDEH